MESRLKILGCLRKLSSENITKQLKKSCSFNDIALVTKSLPIIGTIEKKSQRQKSLKQTSKVRSTGPIFNLILKNAASTTYCENN